MATSASGQDDQCGNECEEYKIHGIRQYCRGPDKVQPRFTGALALKDHRGNGPAMETRIGIRKVHVVERREIRAGDTAHQRNQVEHSRPRRNLARNGCVRGPSNEHASSEKQE